MPERRGPSYTPLPQTGHAIRLIDFAASNGTNQLDDSSQPLQCFVKVYAFQDRAADYQDLTRECEDLGPTRLEQLLNWEQAGHELTLRYTWGDWIALSHCWGDRSTTETVYVNGQPYEISVNMAAGLRAVSKLPAVQSGALKLWNDFLCLNQHNQEEIEQELKRVPHVYGNAFAVVAWIGPAADRSDLAMELFRTKLHSLKGDSIDSGDTLKSFASQEWVALASFLHRPFWGRVWMIQELILAGTRTLMLCGDETAPLAQLWALVKAIIRNTALCHRLLANALGGTEDYYDPVRHQIFSIIPRLLYLHDIGLNHRTTRNEGDYDLLPLLDVSRDSSQQYLRDKVYGVLGLLPPGVTRLIKPDLNKAPHEIYTDLVLASMQALKRLDILQNCVYYADGAAFPTWTPNLAVKRMAHALATRAIMDVGGPLHTQPIVSRTRRSLICRGFFLDVIDHLTPPQWPLNPVSLLEAHQASTLSAAQRPHESIKEALWKTLVGGGAGWPHQEPAPLSYIQLLDLPWPESYDTLTPQRVAEDLISNNWCTPDEKQDLITFVTFRQRAGRDFDLAGHPLESFFSSSPHLKTESSAGKGEGVIWHNRAMLRQACFILKRRRLFVTVTGSLGVSGRQARAGDVVAVLRGCSTPLILRRWEHTPVDDDGDAGRVRVKSDVHEKQQDNQEAYVVIGAAYVEGLMQVGDLEEKWKVKVERDVRLV